MSAVDSFRGISVGDKIICKDKKMYEYEKMGFVEKILIDEGAPNGWFEGEMEDGDKFLFAGEEISRVC